jgi:hypothetical protein
MPKLFPTMKLTTASGNEVIIDINVLASLTLSRVDEQHCLVSYANRAGQGERNFRLHTNDAHSLQHWLNMHSATFQADHSQGVSVWIAKATPPTTGQVIDAMIGRSLFDMEIEQKLMVLLSTARAAGLNDNFIVDMVPTLHLIIKAVARNVVVEEEARRKAAQPGGEKLSMSSGVQAILVELCAQGDDFLLALDTQRQMIRKQDEDVSREAGIALSPIYISEAEQRWVKQSQLMNRLIDMAHIALGKTRMKVSQ